jgi:hypothetical protein
MLQRTHSRPPPEGQGTVRGDMFPNAPVIGPVTPDRTPPPWPVMPTELLSRYQVQLTRRESEPESKLCLEEARQDGLERRWQARIILRLLAVTYTALVLLALVLAVWGDIEQQRWALGALMTVLGSILGFLVGRKA